MLGGLTIIRKIPFAAVLAAVITCAIVTAGAAGVVNDATNAVIEVTINPEARVSIRRTDVSLAMPTCGEPFAWVVRVINHGFVTAALHFNSATPAINLEPVTPPLTGAEVEYRSLHFIMTDARQVDMTLTVDAGMATSDIGSRALLPLLLQCR